MAAAETALQRQVHALYREHHGWLQGWLRRRMGDHPEAADMAQDTFVSVLRAGIAQEIEAPRPFLATVARRLLAHRHRRRLLEDAYLQALAVVADTLVPPPEERLQALELLQQVDTALDTLPRNVRVAFLLAHLDDLTYAEIATRLKVSSSSVKQYLTRANRHVLFALAE